MATEQNTEKAPASRLVLLVALLLLVVDASAAFGRVFQGFRPQLRLAMAAGIAVVLASALERRHVLLALLVSAVGLAMAIGLLIFPSTLKYGLPLAATARAAARAWSMIGDTARTEVAPARPLAPLFLAGLTAVWAASFSAHALAARARSPFLALLPLAALVGFPSILLKGGARPLYVVGFLLGALALLFGDSLRRVGQWGPVTMWQGKGRFSLGTAATTRGARRIGLLCLGVAVLIPGALPGYGRAGLVDVHSNGQRLRVSIDPIVDIRPQLLRHDSISLFVVTSNEPTYWRFASLDIYNGRQWRSDNLEASGGLELEAGPIGSVPALDPNLPNTRVLNQHYQFQGLSGDWMPAAFDPVEIQGPGAKLRYDPRTSMLVDPEGIQPGLSYDVVSRVVVPSFDQLDAVRSLAGAQTGQYVKLPPIPPEISALAHRIADPEPTPYRKILAIQDYLRRFTYKENVAPGHDVDHLVYFLTKLKAGYCEQFAGAMAVMLRTLGIPARVAVGFTTGQPGPAPHTYQVTTQNAHVWVEALFPKYGWLPFEPTPTRRNPAALGIDFPVALSPSGQNGGSASQQACSHPLPGGRIVGDPLSPTCTRGGRKGQRTQQVAHPNTGEGSKVDLPALHPGHQWSWRFLLFAGGALLVALILAAIPIGKAGRRRVALARAKAPRDRVLAAYEIMADHAAGLGFGRVAAETLWEFRIRLKDRVRDLDGDFDRLTGLTGRAAYSDRDIAREQADQALAISRRTVRVLRRAAPGGRRVLAWFWLERPGRRLG